MKNFEQHIHDRFNGREVPVDKNELWANIVPQLESQKKDRKAWYFFLLGLTTGITLLAIYFFSQQPDSKPAQEIMSTTAIAEQQKTNLDTANKQRQKDHTESTDHTSSIANTSNKASKGSDKTDILKTESYLANSSHQPAILNSNSAKITEETFTSPFQTSKNKTTVQSTVSMPFHPTITEEETLRLDQKSSSPFQNENVSLANEEKTTELIRSSALATAALPSLSHALFPVINDYEVKDKENVVIAENKLIIPLQQKNRFGIGFYGGVSATQTVRHERREANFNYAQLRASTEDQLLTHHLGVNMLLELNHNFYFQAGLEYSHIRSRLNLENEKILIDPTLPAITRGISITDTAVVVPDGALVVEVQKNNTTNHFHLVDLPLFIGYQFGKAKWRVGLEAGALVNLSLKKNGELLQKDVTIYDLKEDKYGWYKTNVGVRPHFGLVYTFDLTKYYQLYFNTGMTFNKLFTTDRSLLQEKKSMFGVRMGGRYFF